MNSHAHKGHCALNAARLPFRHLGVAANRHCTCDPLEKEMWSAGCDNPRQDAKRDDDETESRDRQYDEQGGHHPIKHE